MNGSLERIMSIVSNESINSLDYFATLIVSIACIIKIFNSPLGVTPEQLLNNNNNHHPHSNVIQNIVQGIDDALTIAMDGSGDVHFTYKATYQDMLMGRMVDMLLPGERWVSFEIIASSFPNDFTFRNLGLSVIDDDGNVTKGDLHVHVILVLPKTLPAHVLNQYFGPMNDWELVCFKKLV